MSEGKAARLLEIPTLGRDALDRLQRSTIAVIGAGTLGGQLIPHFALLEVGLCIVDSGIVELANLGTQALPAASVGEWKAEVRARQIRELNPDADVAVLTSRVEDLGLAALSNCSLLVVGLDSWTARLRVDELSRRLQKPWIDAAVDGSGERLFGQVTTYDPRQTDSACYGCAIGEEALSTIANEVRGEPCPSWRKPDVTMTEPTLQISPLAGIVAGHQAILALRLLLGDGAELVNQRLLIECDPSPRSPRIRAVRLSRSRRCRYHVDALNPLLPAVGETVGALLHQAHGDLGLEAEQLQFHHRTLAPGLRCPACARERGLVRMSHAYTDDEVRCDCRPGIEMGPVELLASLSRPQARRFADLRWSELGIPARDVVTARSGDRQANYVVNHRGAPERTTPAGELKP